MVKSLTAFAIFCLLGAAVMALPGIAPRLEAREIPALAKADRLAIHKATTDCSTQVWPDFAMTCLRSSGLAAKVVEARLVTARR